MARKSRKYAADTVTDIITNPGTSVAMYRAGGYVRLSAVDKRVKGDSIETQQMIIRAFAEEHPEIELVDMYIDNGLSGQSFSRPGFTRMIEDMESGKINCCLTKDLSRLGRNAIDAGYYIEKFFPTKGIRFIAITDDYDSDTANANGGAGGIMVNLKNMVNEHYECVQVGATIFIVTFFLQASPLSTKGLAT